MPNMSEVLGSVPSTDKRSLVALEDRIKKTRRPRPPLDTQQVQGSLVCGVLSKLTNKRKWREMVRNIVFFLGWSFLC